MYESTLKYTRTPAERADQFLSWQRSDKAFFASGACHILAYVFKDLHPDRNIQLIYIQPPKKFNGAGTHVYALDDEWAFDFNGWSKEDELLKTTKAAYQKKHPGWDYQKIIITDDLETFCKKKFHRPPAYFAYLPWERAYKYIKTFDEFPPRL